MNLHLWIDSRAKPKANIDGLPPAASLSKSSLLPVDREMLHGKAEIPMSTEIQEQVLYTVADLVRSAQLGDRDAIQALYSRYLQSTIQHAYRKLGNWDEAEELAQDVFIQAFERLDQLRVPEAFGAWLRQIVRRMAINRLVRRRPSVGLEAETLEAVCSQQRTPLDDILSIERTDEVRSGLAALGDIDRRTLEAFYVGGQSLIEMAEQFSAPIGTIKRRLHVARKRLAEQIELQRLFDCNWLDGFSVLE
jgi:RNA polymerase sigma-70 factor (ECF subfamily)